MAIARCLETSTTLTHPGLVDKTVEDAGAEVLGDTLGSKLIDQFMYYNMKTSLRSAPHLEHDLRV